MPSTFRTPIVLSCCRCTPAGRSCTAPPPTRHCTRPWQQAASLASERVLVTKRAGQVQDDVCVLCLLSPPLTLGSVRARNFVMAMRVGLATSGPGFMAGTTQKNPHSIGETPNSQQVRGGKEHETHTCTTEDNAVPQARGLSRSLASNERAHGMALQSPPPPPAAITCEVHGVVRHQCGNSA